MLAVLSLLHIASSALEQQGPCQPGVESIAENFLNSRQINYDRFEEVLVSIFKITLFILIISCINSHMFKVTEVFDDGMSVPGHYPGDSDGDI